MKIYLSGANVVIYERATTVIPAVVPAIATDYEIVGPVGQETIQVKDINTGAIYSDLFSNIENEAGATFADLASVTAYLDGLIGSVNASDAVSAVSIVGRDLTVVDTGVTTATPLPSLSGYDTYNTAFFLGGSTDNTDIAGGASPVDMVLTNAGSSISSSIHLPVGLTSIYDIPNNRLDFGGANISDNDFITLDILYDFIQAVDESVLSIIVEFTENTGTTFTKTINISFPNGADVDIEQVSRISFFVGPTLNLGTARILLKCNEAATFKLKNLTIYVHS